MLDPVHLRPIACPRKLAWWSAWAAIGLASCSPPAVPAAKDSGATADAATSGTGTLDTAATDDTVTTDAASGGSGTVSDALAHDATATVIDVSGGVCPGPAKPAADTAVGDVPQPKAPPCPRPPPKFFKGTAPPPKSLQFEVGVVRAAADGSAVFEPYQDGGWVSMDHGPQGGFHVWLALKLPFVSADPQLKVQLEATLLDGCAEIGHTVAPVVYPKVMADKATYLLGSAGVPGVYVVFDEGGDVLSSSSKAYCNRWYDLHVAIREMKSQKWGETTVRVRTYDTR